jgi:hypothetical protein
LVSKVKITGRESVGQQEPAFDRDGKSLDQGGKTRWRFDVRKQLEVSSAREEGYHEFSVRHDSALRSPLVGTVSTGAEGSF